MFGKRKTVVCYVLLFAVCILTACGNRPIKTYKYTSEETELSESILKMQVYDDKVVLHFSEGSLSEAWYVNCYAADFSVIEKQAQLF